jgi:MscS family membrane protein
MLVPVIRKSLRITVVILVLVQIIQILSDKPITSIIAGLGIGGIAIALAAQDSIKNIFGSLVLFTDKPFELGDRVVVDGHDGPIEEVGLRSTKIRTLDGHLVTVPNGELANKTIQNIGKRPYIKRIADITITYDTPPEKVDRALEILKELLGNHEGMKEDFPPRIFFNDFNAASLNLRVMYWYHPPDYWAYMDFTERFNKEVFRCFNEEGIDFAFPTQTLYIAGDASRPLSIGIGKESVNVDV